jgi:hypothetical protein
VQKSPAVLKCKNQTLTTSAKIQNLIYRVEKQQLVSVYSKSCKNIWLGKVKIATFEKLLPLKTNLLQSKIVVSIELKHAIVKGLL